MPISQHRRQEQEDRVSSKLLRRVPDLVDYIIIIPCLKTDKHKNNEQVTKWTGHSRTSEISVFTAWEFDLKALQRYFHYHCPFWIQCSIFLSWERKKPRNQDQTIKLDRNWALVVHGILFQMMLISNFRLQSVLTPSKCVILERW